MVLGELHDLVRADADQGLQTARVATGSDDSAGSEKLRDLHRHRSGITCRPQNQHALSGFDRDSATEGDPGRHGRVHCSGDFLDIGVLGKGNCPSHVDNSLLGHRS